MHGVHAQLGLTVKPALLPRIDRPKSSVPFVECQAHAAPAGAFGPATACQLVMPRLLKGNSAHQWGHFCDRASRGTSGHSRIMELSKLSDLSFLVAASFRIIKLTLAGYNRCGASECTGRWCAPDCPKSWQIVGKSDFRGRSRKGGKCESPRIYWRFDGGPGWT